MAYGFNTDKGKVAVEGYKTLWTNTSPTSAFSAKQITLSESMFNFDFLRIRYGTNTSADSAILFFDVNLSNDDDETATLFYIDMLKIYGRDINYHSNTSVYIDNCIAIDFNSITSSSTDNSKLIPLKIYGVKLG